MSLVIVDYGLCNLDSVRRAVQECGGDPELSDDPRAIERAAKIILPGVAAFSDAMANLRTRGLIPALRSAVLERKTPLLGLCLGMHLLATEGEEGAGGEGLGLIPGKVVRLKPARPEDRVPHVGWNEVVATRADALFEGIAAGKDFYFAHSYQFVPHSAEHALAQTPYCGRFASAVAAGHVRGVQFHPEKSQRAGFQLLRNFLAL